jgi:two-component system chemotaxis response regulator CheB
MPPIKVLVVDDSAAARQIITAILSQDRNIRIIGEASNGREAVEQVLKLQPDLVTLDLEMPIMNGIEALERIMAAHAVPVLVISGQGSAQTAYAAISRGALDVLSKSEINPANPIELINKIKLLAGVKVITHLRRENLNNEGQELRLAPPKPTDNYKIVAIASSAGGPKALAELFSQFPPDFPCPVVIAQHIAEGFEVGLADWLNKIAPLKVKVAEEGETLNADVVYISPSQRHVKVNSLHKIVLVERKPPDLYHPSCDLLLTSVAHTYGKASIGVILTGMGNDGVQGMTMIRAAGGVTIAQDERTSAVFGMPKAAIASGCIDKILPLDKIAGEIIHLLNLKPVKS